MVDQSGFSNSLTYFRPLTLACVRRDGVGALSVADAWRELRGWIATFALEARGPLTRYGLIHKPVTEDETCPAVFDACIELPPCLEPAIRGKLAIQQICGGVYIGSGALDGHAHLVSTMDTLGDDPLLGHGLTLDAERPLIVCYQRKCARHWSLTVNAPLRWAADEVSRAA